MESHHFLTVSMLWQETVVTKTKGSENMSTEIDKISLISLWGDHCHKLCKIHVTFRNPNMASEKKEQKRIKKQW